MKTKCLILLLLSAAFNGFTQYINDTIPRYPFLETTQTRTLISNYETDSAKISVNSIYTTGSNFLYDIQFDSLYFSAHMSINHPWLTLSQKGEIIIIKFYPGGTQIEEFFTRVGSKVKKINFSSFGGVLSYMECDYLKCDECIFERAVTDSETNFRSTTFMRPVTCIENLDWMRLKPEYMMLGAVPVRKVEYLGGQLILDEEILLEKSYRICLEVD